MLPLAITAGEPAGIGPDLLIQLSARTALSPHIVIADPDVLEQRARALGLALTLQEYQPGQHYPARKQQLTVLPVRCPAPVRPGTLNSANAAYVLETLQRATHGCLQQEFAALVTGPLHKGIINDAGIAFTGHTEYLAALTQAQRPVMMLATTGLRVALATTHLPLAEVSRAITQQSLTEVIRILHHDLQHSFGIPQPRILVSGLNPHAGEGGHLGNEEITIIEPVLQSLQQQGLQLTGPLPADTLFTPRYLEQADAVLAMYHDQGLPVLKYAGFGNAINITLGLPIIRTSVDHGTALDLAGSGKADTSSLQLALSTASELARHQQTPRKT